MTALQAEIMRSRARIQIIGREGRDTFTDLQAGKLFEKLAEEIANLAWLAAQEAGNDTRPQQGEGG